MNTVDIDQLSTLSVLCSIICKAGGAIAYENKNKEVCHLYAIGQQIDSLHFNSFFFQFIYVIQLESSSSN